MSDYLTLAKKAKKDVPNSPEALSASRDRKLEEASRRGLVIRWAEYPTWMKLHDPTTGQWHEVEASGCLPSVVAEANKYRKKGARREG